MPSFKECRREGGLGREQLVLGPEVGAGSLGYKKVGVGGEKGRPEDGGIWRDLETMLQDCHREPLKNCHWRCGQLDFHVERLQGR